MAHLKRLAAAFVLLCAPVLALAQPAVKSFITVADMVAANPFQVADPTANGGRTATVMVQQTAAAYALTNTWSGTNMSTLIASSTPQWAWQLLPIASGPNFYTSDGTLNGARTVNLGSNPLLWLGPSSITSSNVSSFLTYASGPVAFTTPGDILLAPGTRLLLRTPLVGAAHVGDPLLLKNVGSGEAEFGPFQLPPTLYTGDGTLNGPRTVTMGGSSLTFKGPGAAGFSGVDNFTVIAPGYAQLSSAGNVILESSGRISLRTPSVIGGGAQQGQVLKLSGPNGQVEFGDAIAGGTTNIYNSDGILLGNRTVNTTNYFLQFKGTGTFAVSNAVADIRGVTAQMLGGTTTLGGTNSLRAMTPAIFLATAQTGQVLTLKNAGTGEVEYQSPTALPTVNIYNSDGTLTSDRTVTAASRRMIFTNATTFAASGQTAALLGSSALQLATPGVFGATAQNGQALFLTDASNGKVEFGSTTNLYVANGTLTGDRTVQGNSRFLAFTNLSQLDARAATTTLGGSTKLELKTPLVSAGSAVVGQVLTLDAATGQAEFHDPVNANPVNIYNSDGRIQSATRNVDLSTNTLYFNNALGRAVFNSIGYFAATAKTNFLYSSEEWVGGGSLRTKFATPRTGGNGASAGNVLTLVDAVNSIVDFHPAYNLYTTNGTLTGNRIVDANFRDLSLTNVNVFDVRGRTSVVSGSLELDVRTPRISGAQAAANQVFTLLDASTGRSDFMPLPTPTDINIYANDGTLTADRTLTTGARLLTIQASGGGNLDFINYNRARYYGSTNDLYSSLLTSIASGGPLRIIPTGGRNVGDLLSLTATSGDVAWSAPVNLYAVNGTLASDRTVQGNGRFLNLTNLAAGTLSSVTSMIRGNTINIVTTNITAGTAVAGQILTLADASTGRVEYSNAPTTGGSVNIYNSNGSLTSGRTVSLAANTLLFAGPGSLNGQNLNSSSIDGTNFTWWARGNFNLYGGATWLQGGTSLKIATPKVVNGATAKAGDVLTLSATDGTAEWQTQINTPINDTTLYDRDGTLSGPRTLTGNNNNLTFTGVNTFTASAQSAEIAAAAAGKLRLKTPGYATRQGQFLQLIDQGTGEVEFATPSVQNLYTVNGSLTGNRTVTIPSGMQLLFVGPGTLASAALASVALTGTQGGFSFDTTLEMEGHGEVRLKTPGYATRQGQFLQLIDQATGKVEYTALPPYINIYSNNGALSADRTVTLASKTLKFQGAGNVDFNTATTFDVTAVSRAKMQSSGELDLSGQTFRVRTPNVNGGSAQVGQALVLQSMDAGNSTQGRVEFQSIAGSASSPIQFETPLTDTSQPVAPSTLWFNVGTLNPLYTGALPEPPTGTRLVARVTRPNAPGGWYNTGSGGVSISFPIPAASGADTTYRRNVYTSSGSELNQGTLKEGTVVDLIFFRNWSGTGLPGAWIMVNANYPASFLAQEMSTNPAFGTTNSLGAVRMMSFAGVVDLQSDLAFAPVGFKKISTLGLLAIGDGQHADYYLASYDPNAPIGEIIRSSVDLTKMWRKLK